MIVGIVPSSPDRKLLERNSTTGRFTLLWQSPILRKWQKD